MTRPDLRTLRRAGDWLDRRHPRKGFGLEVRRAVRYLHHLEREVIRLAARPAPAEVFRTRLEQAAQDEQAVVGLMIFGETGKRRDGETGKHHPLRLSVSPSRRFHA